MNIETFRTILKKKMAEENIKQKELAEMYFLDQAALSRFLSGKTKISGEYVFRLWNFAFPDFKNLSD